MAIMSATETLLAFVCAAVIVVTVIVQVFALRTRKRVADELNLPPEFPYPKFPVLGHLPYLAACWALTRLRFEEVWDIAVQRTGNAPIVRFQTGKCPYVILSDSDSVRAVLRTQECNHRREGLIIFGGCMRNGITASNGERHLRTRKFAIQSMKPFIGRASDNGEFDAMLVAQLRELFDIILPARKDAAVSSNGGFVHINHAGELENGRTFHRCEVDFKHHVYVMAMNTILWIFTRKTLNLSSKQTEKLAKAVESFLGNGTLVDGVDLVPCLLKILPTRLSGLKRLNEDSQEISAFFMDVIVNELESREPGKPRHALDEIADVLIGLTVKEVNLDAIKEQLLGPVVDLVVSADTAGAALAWCLVYVAAHPWAQKKVQEEIFSLNLDAGKFPSYSLHSKRMPFTLANMSEALRLGSPAPLLFEHFAAEDVHLPQCTIPKGTAMLGNVYKCHREKKHWPHPDRFWPERFLEFGPDGLATFRSKDNLLAFSTGKRRCPGEQVSWHIMFNFLTGILSLYDLELSGGDLERALKPNPESRLVRCPSSLRMRVSTHQPSSLNILRRQ